MSDKQNIALIIFDIIFLPIIILRLIIIYFFGSKYNINRMEFLDVMFHANKPYFNQESDTTIDVLHEDVRATIKRETKLFEDPFLQKEKEQLNEQENKQIQSQSVFSVKQTKPLVTQTESSFEILTKTKSSEESSRSGIFPKTSDKLENKHKIQKKKVDSESSPNYESEGNSDTKSDNSNNDSDNDSDNDSNNDSDNEVSETEQNTEIETESERILDTETEISHATTEAENVLDSIMNKKTDFNLDVHINQLFDDLENSVTTITQSQIE